MRLLSLDVGSRRTGVALSDPEEIVATPLAVLEHQGYDELWQALEQLLQEYEIEQIVVGLPLSLDGSVGPQAREVQAFLSFLALQTELPIITWDERFSTAAAEQKLEEAGVKKAQRKNKIDAMAATLLLQDYMEAARYHQPEEGQELP